LPVVASRHALARRLTALRTKKNHGT
jgi:hypothetical protein